MSLFAIVAPLPADYIGMRTRDVASPPMVLLGVAIVVYALGAKAQPEPVRVAYSQRKVARGAQSSLLRCWRVGGT